MYFEFEKSGILKSGFKNIKLFEMQKEKPFEIHNKSLEIEIFFGIKDIDITISCK
jgi:hypothetical protein